METLWLVLAVSLLVVDIQGCRQPLQPVYNASAKRYLTCNSWEPDCPEDTVCQRATPEWKERLYTNPEFVLYLCCNKDGRLKEVEPEPTTPMPSPPPTSFAPISIPTIPPVDIVPDPIIVPLPATSMPVDAKKNEIMFENPKPNQIYSYPLASRPNVSQQIMNNAQLPVQFQQVTQAQPDVKPQSPQPNPPTQPAPQQIPAPALPSQSQVQSALPTLAEAIPAQAQAAHIPHIIPQPPPSVQAHITAPAVPQYPQELPQVQSPVQPVEPQPINQLSQAPLTSLPHLRIFSQQLEAQIASAIAASKQTQSGQQLPSPVQPVPVSTAEATVMPQEQITNGNSIFALQSPSTTLSNSLSITQSQPPLPMGVQPKPGILPSPPLGKLAALAPQPQVLAAGNGNRVVLGPNICLLVLGEFSQPDKDLVFRYRGTVALIQDSGLNILVDTGSANSKNKLIAALAQQGLRPQNIQVVIYTHAHPDHLGNDNLFPYAQKFFAGAVYKGDEFLPLQQLEEPSMRLTQHVEIWKTPGHTMQHNSILVRNVSSEYVNGTVAISGDLFLNDRDFDNTEQWTTIAVDRDIQKQLRYVLLCQADYIIPGHGKPFAVTPAMRSTANCSARKLLAYRYALAHKSKKSRRKTTPLLAFHHD